MHMGVFLHQRKGRGLLAQGKDVQRIGTRTMFKGFHINIINNMYLHVICKVS
jgi:hypothetical protein